MSTYQKKLLFARSDQKVLSAKNKKQKKIKHTEKETERLHARLTPRREFCFPLELYCPASAGMMGASPFCGKSHRKRNVSRSDVSLTSQSCPAYAGIIYFASNPLGERGSRNVFAERSKV